jgi:propionyl-CoA carboxylase alpha chain
MSGGPKFDGNVISVQVRSVPTILARAPWRGGGVFVYTELEAVRCAADGKEGIRYRKAWRAPMPGLVVTILVTPGREVKAEPLAVVEAKKMENVFRAERDGVVKSIRAKPGDNVAVGGDHGVRTVSPVTRAFSLSGRLSMGGSPLR